MPVKSLFASGLLGLAAGLSKRLSSLAEMIVLGAIEPLILVPVKGIIA
jgi:hypothetical protein